MQRDDTPNDPRKDVEANETPRDDSPAAETTSDATSTSDDTSTSDAASTSDDAAPATEASPSQALDDLEAAWTAAGDAEPRTRQEVEEDEEDEEVDPELLRLPRPPRRRRHPIISLLVIGMSIYLMQFGWHEFRYFFESNIPRDLGEVADAVQKGFPDTNIYVTLRGAPDRKHALLLQGRVSGYESFFRLRQGRDLVFVQRHRKTRASQGTIEAEHVGRLVRFSSLPYKAAIRSFFAKRMNVAHDLDFDTLARAKAGKAIIDKQGLPVTLDAKTLLWINVRYPHEWLIQFPKNIYKTRQEARAQLNKLTLPVAAEDEPSPSFWRFVVLASDAEAKKLMNIFAKPKLRTNVLRRQVSYTAHWGQLQVKDKTLVIAEKDETFPSRYLIEGDKLIPKKPSPVIIDKADLLYVTTSSPFTIPPNAVVLLTGEVPHDSWIYVLLYAILSSFILFNLWALIQRLRQR